MIDAMLDPCPWIAAGGILFLTLLLLLGLWSIESHTRCLEDERRRNPPKAP